MTQRIRKMFRRVRANKKACRNIIRGAGTLFGLFPPRAVPPMVVSVPHHDQMITVYKVYRKGGGIVIEGAINDRDALARDWSSVGDDINRSIEVVAAEIPGVHFEAADVQRLAPR